MVAVNPLARVLGFGLLQSIANRLPPAAGIAISVVLVLVADLFPVLPLLSGAIRLPDLLLYYFFALVIGIGANLIRARTLGSARGSARAKDRDTDSFLVLHSSFMVGIFALVCGVWAIIIGSMLGVSGGWWALLPMALAVILGQAWQLADTWFVRGARFHTKLWHVLLPSYLILAPYLMATCFGAFVAMGQQNEADLRAIALALIGAQTLIDLTLTLVAARRALRERR